MDTKNVSHKDISQNYSKQFQTGWHAEGIDINESGGPQHQNWQENRESEEARDSDDLFSLRGRWE